MKRLVKFPSIEQFRNVIRTVCTQHDYQGKDENDNPIYNHLSPYPTLQFKGTVKMHGTNAGIVKFKDDDEIQFQSKENTLTLRNDNAGFALAMSQKQLNFLFEGLECQDYVAVYGEWIGKGIQKGVAVSELPKTFVIFGCKVDGNWITYDRFDNTQGIWNINQFPSWTVDIDFNNPQLIQNRLVELTMEVEAECPVGKHLGVIGIGEGIVWTSLDLQHKFKSKGEAHSASKVKTIASVDVEQLNSMNEFVEYAVTENRLKQGVEVLRTNGTPITEKSTGDFLRWVVNDIWKEEADTIVENQIDKKVNSLISTKARLWWFNNLD